MHLRTTKGNLVATSFKFLINRLPLPEAVQEGESYRLDPNPASWRPVVVESRVVSRITVRHGNSTRSASFRLLEILSPFG
jgi:hypothetical protein